MLKRLRHWLRRDEEGSVVIMVAAGLTAIMGLAALGTDVGRIYIERQRLSVAADAAVLSGAQVLLRDPDGALANARQNLQKNGYDPNSSQVWLNDDRDQINVQIADRVGMTFARVVGFANVDVEATATAWSGYVSGFLGAVPLGVPQADWQIGQQVTLKLDADTGTIAPGNYMALALGRTGASMYEQNLMYGYNGWIRVDQWISTETGNMATPTVRGINYRINQDPYATWDTVTRQSPRLAIVPILRDYNVNGRGEVLVTGFAVFFIERAEDKGNDKGEITGRFLRLVTEGEASGSAPDFGLSVTKLIR